MGDMRSSPGSISSTAKEEHNLSEKFLVHCWISLVGPLSKQAARGARFAAHIMGLRWFGVGQLGLPDSTLRNYCPTIQLYIKNVSKFAESAHKKWVKTMNGADCSVSSQTFKVD